MRSVLSIAKTPFGRSSKQAPLDELDSLLEEDWSDESAVTNIVIQNNIPPRSNPRNALPAPKPESTFLRRAIPIATLILVALIELARELDFFIPEK